MKDFNSISIAGGIIGGILAFLFGGFDVFLKVLITVMALDYITGVAKAAKLKNVSSEIGYWGLIKKVIIAIVVMLASVMQYFLDEAISVEPDTIPLRAVIITFFICNEGLSILENAAIFIPIPDKLKEILLQLRDSTKKEDKNDEDNR